VGEAKADDEHRLNDDEINAKYGKRELRIVTEMNREQVPNFVEAHRLGMILAENYLKYALT
jgi:hypothetical protein